MSTASMIVPLPDPGIVPRRFTWLDLRFATAIVVIMTTAPALAQIDGVAARARVAQLVTLAKEVPLLCPDFEADEDALRVLMEHADVSERDVMDPKVFGVQDELVARSFANSVKENAVQSCADVTHYLGSGGAHLLRPKPVAPD